LIDNPALPPAQLASNVVDELALHDGNGHEVSEEEFLNRLDDPATVQSELKALQDNSDASVLALSPRSSSDPGEYTALSSTNSSVGAVYTPTFSTASY